MTASSAAYRELLARLLPARRFGIVLGLDRMRALLDRLGAPDKSLGTVIHVGGTNGKGSTVAMSAALAATKLRVATYTSPHLSCLRERITIDGEMIGEAAIVAAAERVRAAGGDELTFFEQLTAIACVAIAEAQVDVTVLEVGLGGRLDATNVVDAPIAVVTGVAMDHESILGDTLDAIAAEKAGIFKRDQRVVIGASGEPRGMWMLELFAKCAHVGAITMIGSGPTDDRAMVQQDALAVLKQIGRLRTRPDEETQALLATHREGAIDGREFEARIRAGIATTLTDETAIAGVPALSLPGAHQRRNAAAALAAIDHLEIVRGISIDEASRARALANVRYPGRFEIVEGTPRLILDGAHNPHGAAALAETLRERGERPALVLAVSADKDTRAIVTALAPAVCAIVATRYQQDRALPPEELARVAREGVAQLPVEQAGELAAQLPVEQAGELAAAVEIAARYASTVLIAGSLFVVGEARTRYLAAPTDPVLLSDPAKLGAP